MVTTFNQQCKRNAHFSTCFYSNTKFPVHCMLHITLPHFKGLEVRVVPQHLQGFNSWNFNSWNLGIGVDAEPHR